MLKKEHFIHIRTLLFVTNVGWFTILLVAYSLNGENYMFNNTTILLSFFYFLILNLSIIMAKGQSKPVIFTFVIINMLYYSQRLVFIYLFPSVSTYSRYFYFTKKNLNLALFYLLMCSASALFGFKIGEKIKVKLGINKDVLENWYHSYIKRVRFYKIALAIILVRILLYFEFISPKYWFVWTDNFVGKLFLHFIEFHALLVVIPIIFLVNPLVVKSRKEKLIIYFLICLYSFSIMQSGSKDVVGSILLTYLFICFLFKKYSFPVKKSFFILMIATIITCLMFPLSLAIKAVSLEKSWSPRSLKFFYREAVVEDREIRDLPVPDFLKSLLPLSRRLRGIDWIEVAMLDEIKNELSKYYSFTNLLKMTINRNVPLPRKFLFPNTLSFAAAYTITVYNVPLECTFHHGDYPSLFGLSYILLGYKGIILLILWGIISAIVLRSSNNVLFKAIYLSFCMNGLMCSGDIIQMIKSLIVYFLYFQLIRFFVNIKRA